MSTLIAGSRIGPYEILALIGAGGMGQVWKARDTRLDRIVAIKVAQEKFSDRFEREARAVTALNHPHICTLYDVGPDYLGKRAFPQTDLQPLQSPALERVIRTCLAKDPDARWQSARDVILGLEWTVESRTIQA